MFSSGIEQVNVEFINKGQTRRPQKRRQIKCGANKGMYRRRVWGAKCPTRQAIARQCLWTCVPLFLQGKCDLVHLLKFCSRSKVLLLFLCYSTVSVIFLDADIMCTQFSFLLQLLTEATCPGCTQWQLDLSTS